MNIEPSCAENRGDLRFSGELPEAIIAFEELSMLRNAVARRLGLSLTAKASRITLRDVAAQHAGHAIAASALRMAVPCVDITRGGHQWVVQSECVRGVIASPHDALLRAVHAFAGLSAQRLCGLLLPLDHFPLFHRGMSYVCLAVHWAMAEGYSSEPRTAMTAEDFTTKCTACMELVLRLWNETFQFLADCHDRLIELSKALSKQKSMTSQELESFLGPIATLDIDPFLRGYV